jgi:hypothetical protein
VAVDVHASMTLAARSSCYSHPWVAVLICAAIVVAAVAALYRSESVARFFVESIGPWRVDPVAKTQWRESIDAWTKIVRLLVLFFATSSILIASLAMARSLTCG